MFNLVWQKKDEDLCPLISIYSVKLHNAPLGPVSHTCLNTANKSTLFILK